MSFRSFVGRREELALLDSLWSSPHASLLILYGRRRVGKTRLLTHWLKSENRHGMYWVAEPTSALDQLRSFSQAIYNFTSPDEPAPLDFTYANWDQAFRQVAMMAQNQKFIFFLDELGYLIEVNPALTGILQKAWDHWLSKSNIILALSGSQMGLMQKMLSYEAPLYGRATAQIKLPPLPFTATKSFFPNYSAKERVELYAIWGGVPAYWERLDVDTSILENVSNMLLPSNTLMQEEPRLLLQDFISDSHNYVGIMRAIAGGAVTNNRISTRTGLSKGHISKYLSVLRDTGFVERMVPVTEDPASSRRGHYYITDPYMRFHYRFLSAYQTKIALGEQAQMLTQIEEALDPFVESNTWTELCRQWVLRASSHSEIPVQLEDVGGAWLRTDFIDVVGINQREKQIVLGSCHWRKGLGTLSDIENIIRKAAAIMQPLGEQSQWRVYYLGFSREGWNSDARSRVDDVVQAASQHHPWKVEGVQLVDLKQVDDDLTRWTDDALENEA